jgi:cold shock protein
VTVKGYGFIGQGGKDIFVHASALERSAIVGLAEGQRVAVDVAEAPRDPKWSACGCCEVRNPCGAR